MQRRKKRTTRHWLRVIFVVALLVGGTIQADCADLGQGNDITRSTADVIHEVAKWEAMAARLEYQLDHLEAESVKCRLVGQGAEKAVCDARLRDLYEAAQALYRSVNKSAAGLEAEIARVRQKADPHHLEILARMQKKLSQRQSQINQRLRSVSGSG